MSAGTKINRCYHGGDGARCGLVRLCSIWSDTTVPSVESSGDTGAVEFGVTL